MIIQITAIARNTFTELVRQKIFYIILVFALCAIGSSVLMARLTFQEEFQMLRKYEADQLSSTRPSGLRSTVSGSPAIVSPSGTPPAGCGGTFM